ncbi:DUF4349 domain-containing protein [Demequina lignilytica]|uniref:DUF4349 domain-containing protein n=1 Tax=Demequina lignilytica TaxID=3051663 RepID=A0AAW7M0P3_9MICO|nr:MULTISPECIES: DUF4349 domain-containing protein [unclassified Demequina]MDN4477910.1 DUF4349 domain-containing protein [Demequina sp. SYSU T00039-1]MDN4484293.1 DUF4349 domain-containing protein [Demequina sp. SYSU T0a273]MDN4487819.1 DUF4349 domain-containing protein [Demequina sp. SYSU T00039]
MSTHAHPPRPLLRWAAILCAVLAVVWALTGCTSGSSDSSEGGAVGGDAAYDQGAPAEAEDSADGSTASSADTAGEDRALIVTGSMYVTVEDPIAAADRAAAMVESAGGRIDARSERAATEYDGGSAWLTLRIPQERLDAVVDDLRGLGTVDEYSTTSADVTREVQDLEARISTLRASTERIAALLGEAEKIADIITLENELASRQAELESLEAWQRGLDDQVAMSTIELSLTTEPVVVVDDAPRSFWAGVVSGWDALVGFLTGALVITGVVLPWLAAAGVIVIAAWLVLRSRRARRRDVAPASSEPPSAP